MTATAAGPGTGRMGMNDQVTHRLMDERIIVLGTAVDDVIGNVICAQLLLLAADSRKDISLYINSPGGSVTAGLAVYDTMQLIENDVLTVGMGLSASMGQFLLTAGAPGKRLVLPSAQVLMHQPSAGLGGSASEIRIQAEHLMRTKQRLIRITAERTGRSVEEIRRDSDRDRWFSAEEAVAYGLADRVEGSVGIPGAAVTAG
ncbi:ATP-dependent Clp protease proteolytic subunit [Kitasatospora sp. NPDC018058]|uniref:ATP-dependent Clp protease proteolytic subunit n=1 Tax=Kitasatospora sp. NPDC018058 TaxID=3364025 RepID=UPI0037C1B10E